MSGRGRIVVAVLVLVLGWLGWRLWRRHEPSVAREAAIVDTTSAGLRSARLYFASPSGDGLVAESRDLPERAELRERVTALVAELERGPQQGGARALPAGTAVQHVYLDEHGLMTLDLTRAFQDRFEGGSTAEYLALASLVRTLAANVPEVKRVQIVCGGASIPTLGGHLPLDRPLDVSEWP
jgi:hypothetical protein